MCGNPIAGERYQVSNKIVCGNCAAKAPDQRSWGRKLGPLGPIALLLAKGKTLLLLVFKLKSIFSFLAFIGFYAAIFGWRYGIGIAVSILIHEMGHYVDIKRRGLPAEAPVFIPGLMAYVRWDAMGVSLQTRAQISLAGPLAGWFAAGCCYLLYAQTGDMLWAALARTGAFINVLNLIPIPMLDGGQAVKALGLVERLGLLAVCLALWLYTDSAIFAFVGAGLLWRLFTKDKPAEDNWGIWAYYAGVLAALALVLRAVPAGRLPHH
jgi:Zn-dependent protease